MFTRGGAGSSSSYAEAAKLQASDIKQAFVYFGKSVSTSADGSTVVVGAPGESISTYIAGSSARLSAGAAYVFTRGGGSGSGSYTQVAKLQASDKQAYVRFGTSVSMSGDGRTIAAGAIHSAILPSAIGGDGSSDNPGTKATRGLGVVYIFAPATTPTPPRTTSPDPPPSGDFPGVPTRGAGSRVPVSNAPTLTGLSVAIGISTLLVCYNSASS